MPVSLREQALERMKQLQPFDEYAAPKSDESETRNTPASSAPSKNSEDSHSASIPTGVQSILQFLDLDRDRIILLILLFVLYRDHASLRILFSVLYLML